MHGTRVPTMVQPGGGVDRGRHWVFLSSTKTQGARRGGKGSLVGRGTSIEWKGGKLGLHIILSLTSSTSNGSVKGDHRGFCPLLLQAPGCCDYGNLSPPPLADFWCGYHCPAL